MSEDTTIQHDAPPSPGNDHQKISMDSPAFTSLDTPIQLDTPLTPSNDDKNTHTDRSVLTSLDPPIQLDAPPTPSYDDKDPHADLPVLTSIDTGGLISLLRLLTNFKRSQNDLWDLVGMPDPESWKLFQTASQAVEMVTVIQQPSQEGTITPATFVRIARMLTGEPLFPSLRHLQIENLTHDTSNYVALLAAPTLEHVTLIYHPTKDPDPQQAEDTDYSELTIALFTDLTFYSKKLKILHVKKADPPMPISLLQTISNFSELRVLKLECLLRVPVGEFDVYIRCLEHLRSLEALWLRLEEIVTDESSHQTPQLVEPISILPELLPTIQLDIVGPAHLVSKIISTFGSKALETVSISLSCASDLPANSPTLDLKPLRQVTGLQSLHISECVIGPPIELFKPGVWLHLVSLILPSSSKRVDLMQLKTIAEALPSLRVLRLRLFEFANLSPPGITTVLIKVPLHHPLENLELLTSRARSSAPSQKLDQVYQCIKVARYLDALFPKLQSLTARRDKEMWNAVFELMKLCQTSLVVDKNRRNLFPEM